MRSLRDQDVSVFRVRDVANRSAANSGTSTSGKRGHGFGGPSGEYFSANVPDSGGLSSTSKPFLEELFEDLRLEELEDATYDAQERAVTTHDPRLPSASLREQVRRQAAKPAILQFTVSTDAVPLTTTTAPFTYTMFDPAPYTDPNDPTDLYLGAQRSHALAGSHGAIAMRRTREATTYIPGQRRRVKDDAAGRFMSATSGSSATLRVTGAYEFYNEAEEVNGAHLKYLLSTIALQRQKQRAFTSAPSRRPLWLA